MELENAFEKYGSIYVKNVFIFMFVDVYYASKGAGSCVTIYTYTNRSMIERIKPISL